ncbi:PucR family transcriptional regulator [Corynebacterium sp. TAE3-ERU12]|uniref:PucR family transcriptional regulator n=1 Tax=Corynebacterium sp. TAE3-ERU12 TaxID=2849491 RepID=UPI001C4851F9|nr:PucR family transcriptional regulator [Corynebacterium sp. TAE3-ERU12]MBV7296007.1 PucR family transcriptional regulator [Corynebacterium sp. TAE3-ERU12]
MLPTVADLADRPELGLTVLAGQVTAAQAPVEWAHAIDRTDVDRWIAPGTLVLTSGFQMPASGAGLAHEIDRLHAVGAAAVAIDLAGRWSQVPEELIERGVELGFPVLSVKPEVPFSTVVRTVAEAVTAARVRSLSDVVEQQAALVRSLLRGGLPQVLADFGTRYSAMVAVLNNSGATLASFGDTNDTLPRPPFSPSVGPSRLHRGGTRIVRPLTGVVSSHGALVVDCPTPIAPTEHILVSHVAALASLALSRSLAVHEIEQRLRGEAMRAIRSGRVPPREQLALFQLSPVSTVRALDVRTSGVPAETVSEELHGLGCNFLHATTATGHLIVHDGSDEIADLLAKRLGRSARIGAGDPMVLTEVDVSIRQAELAVPRQGSGIRRISDMPAHELVLGVLSEDAAAILAGGLLRRLEEHDAATGDETVAAAEAFLEANGRFEAMARRLGVHRQTARSRADRIEEVLGVSLDDPDTRAELWLALRSRLA